MSEQVREEKDESLDIGYVTMVVQEKRSCAGKNIPEKSRGVWT